jgi:hypothetical protein
MKNSTADDGDAPLAQTLRIVELIDCVAANAPVKNGRPVTMVTLAHLGELEQPLCLSFDDSKLLVTKLLQSLSDHGNEYAEYLLEEHFSQGKKKREREIGGDLIDEGEDEADDTWKKDQEP